MSISKQKWKKTETFFGKHLAGNGKSITFALAFEKYLTKRQKKEFFEKIYITEK